MKTWLWMMTVLLVATAVNAAEEGGPVVRQGGMIGELRTFTARGLSSSGTQLFTTPATGWFTLSQVCGNTTKSNDRDIDVRIFAGDLHVATLFEAEGGTQPKCFYFPAGMVLPPNTPVKCEGGSSHECWVTGVCSRGCTLPPSN